MSFSERKFEPWKWLTRRNAGNLKFRERKQIYSHIYLNIEPVLTWNPLEVPKNRANNGHHGAIFNFDYSTDGSILIAACQHKSFIMFDPFNGRFLGEKLNAHSNCVNCVRFLDTRLFATCSDDKTVALWDCRYLKTKIRSLTGHDYWVKNIEYDTNNNLLVTSGFDGKICTWDINNYSGQNDEHKAVLTTRGLMRSKLSPDNSKLIISTSRGYMIIIHDLNLHTLSQDLYNFKPDVYRVHRKNAAGQSELVVKDNPFFHRKTNRVEFISDFPSGNDAEVIASLQVHPHSWCIVSRNTSANIHSEWVCVHDIQSSFTGTSEAIPQASTSKSLPPRTNSVSVHTDSLVNSETDSSISTNISDTADYSSTDDEYEQSLAEAMSTFRERAGLSVSMGEDSTDDSDSSDSISVIPINEDIPSNLRHSSLVNDHYKHPALQVNKPRLMYYKQEPNVGEGFIKELCFSHDGRVICSPHKDGVRLLTFNENCDEICDCVTSEVKKLQVYQHNQSHYSYVLATKFSPIHYMFVSGSLSGKVVFHQPIL